MSLSEHLKGTVQLSPRPRGIGRSSNICRMSVYGNGKYAVIRLSDAAIKETGFKANAPLYLHAQPSFLVVTSEGSGRPFYFRNHSSGRNSPSTRRTTSSELRLQRPAPKRVGRIFLGRRKTAMKDTRKDRIEKYMSAL
jgi:hypothetical protein